MRISDWSSDVCSSDLMGRLLRRQNVMSRYTRAWRHLLRQYERAVDRIDEEDRAIFLGHRVEELSYRQLAERHGVSVVEVEEAMIRSKIGRASCRERVCQYV